MHCNVPLGEHRTSHSLSPMVLQSAMHGDDNASRHGVVCASRGWLRVRLRLKVGPVGVPVLGARMINFIVGYSALPRTLRFVDHPAPGRGEQVHAVGWTCSRASGSVVG